MRKTNFFKTLLVAVGLCAGVNAWGGDTTTLLEYGTTDVAWTEERLATWSGKGATLASDASYVQYAGTDNSDFSTYKTISPASGTILNITAVWRARSNTGRYWSNGCGIYFRFGNIVVAQNDQDQRHGYVFTGLSNMSSVTTFTAGSYRTDIASLPWLKIEMEINTTTNTLTSFSVKSEDGKTTYASASKIALTSADYTTVAFGFQRGGSHNTQKQEQLKSIKITQTTQDVSYADYTVHFVDGDGATIKADEVRNGEVGATVHANDNDTQAYYNGGYKYVYNNDGDGVEVVAAGTSELTVTYDKFGQYTYNVYAVNSSNEQLSATPIATATAYAGEDVNLVWNKYVKIDGQWYVTSENIFKATATEAGTKNVVYTTSDIAYFSEMENLTRSGGAYLTEVNASYSGNARLRLSRGSTYYTPALPAGVYQLTIGCANSNASSSDVYVYTRSGEGVLSDVLYTHTATNGSTTLSTIVTVPEGYSIAFNGNEGSNNNNARMDYMTLTSVKVSKTISAAGYATYCSPYALDFSGVTGLTAYIAAKDGTKVKFTPVDNVPANTGVLLKGAEGGYSIPAIASSTTDVEDNILTGVLANTSIEIGDYGYVLMNVSNVVGFYKTDTTKGFTVGANTAYIKSDKGLSRMFIGFDDDEVETTGINEVKTMKANNAIYNLKGMKVKTAQKGLYIINGKKVVK